MAPPPCPDHETQGDRIEAMVKDIHLAIYGDHSEGRPGLKIEVDRLKQSEARRSKFMWTALGASLAALAGTIKTWANS